MSRFDDELRHAASQLAREPLPAEVLDEALDGAPPVLRWPAVASATLAGVLVVVGAGIGIREFMSPASSPATTLETSPQGTSQASPGDEPDGTATATNEELGIRLTLTLDRGRSSFGQRVWADATVENLGPGSVYYWLAGGCEWPVSIEARPKMPPDVEQLREEWPVDMLQLRQGRHYVDVVAADGLRAFLPEEHVDSDWRFRCFMSREGREIQQDASVGHRAAWDTEDALAHPPALGRYDVEVTFTFQRDPDFEGGTDPELDAKEQSLTLSVPLEVEASEADGVSAAEAVDALVSDEAFRERRAELPSDRWQGGIIELRDDRWIVTFSFVVPGEPQRGKLIGEIDARSGAVLDVRLEMP